MAGRRLVDAAKLFNASKSVVQQHLKLRSQQLDVYSRTSTLAKAAKTQTDRVTLTLEAAIALSHRLNEGVPKYASAAAQQRSGLQTGDIPRNESFRETGLRRDVEAGIEQDHRYDASGNNRKQSPAEEELSVLQEDVIRRPLPDRTIPMAGVSFDNDTRGQDTSNKRTVPEPPTKPSAEAHGREEKVDEGITPIGSNASTMPIPDQPAGTLRRPH